MPEAVVDDVISQLCPGEAGEAVEDVVIVVCTM